MKLYTLCVVLGGAGAVLAAAELLCWGGQAGQPDRTIGRTDHRLGGSARTNRTTVKWPQWLGAQKPREPGQSS